MNEVILSNSRLPVTEGCGFLAAAESFRHVDRTAAFNVMIYVTEGVIYVTEDGTDYSVSQGELLFLKSGVHHCGRYDIPKGTKWFYAHFRTAPDSAAEFAPDNGYSCPESTLTLPKYLKGLSGSDIEQEISSFSEYCTGSDRFRGWYINQRLFMLLSRIALSERYEEAPPTLSDRICAYLQKHRDEPFRAESISREFFLSYKHLAAIFRRETGKTMQQYHTALRMDEACRLLRSTLLSVGEIAAAVGYQDMLYFSRCFHAFSGASPTAYRRKTQMM